MSKRGKKSKSNELLGKGITKETEASSLYPQPERTPWQYARTLYVISDDPKEIILPSERRQQIINGRDLFAKMPLVAATIKNKNHVAVGAAWQPVFTGDIRTDASGNPLQEDLDWIKTATDWMVNDYFVNLNWQGQNFSFTDTLYLTGKDIDVDGGSLMIKRTTKSGVPRIQLLPVDRIGSRGGEKTVTGGSYDGYLIYDGIILNADGMPIALKILGSTADTDQIISLFNCHYIFESDWTGALHGVSRIANSVTTLKDVKDIVELLKATIKKQSEKAIIIKNLKGAPQTNNPRFGKEVTPDKQDKSGEDKIKVERVVKGSTDYFSSTDGSDMTAFNFDTPSVNTKDFLFSLMGEAVASMGWQIELVMPSGITGPSVRAVQDQARKQIVWRQQTLLRRARSIVQFGLSVAMQNGIIPKTTNKTWLKWNFQMPPLLTIDDGYDNQAAMESLKMGITSKSKICARRGDNWQEVDKQVDAELDSLFSRAEALAKKFNITPAEARQWLSQRDIDILAPQLAKGATPAGDPQKN